MLAKTLVPLLRWQPRQYGLARHRRLKRPARAEKLLGKAAQPHPGQQASETALVGEERVRFGQRQHAGTLAERRGRG